MLGGANPAHKCSRTSSSFSSNKSLATQNRQATCSVCNRQPNCSNIHKQIRWNPLTSTFTLSNRTMAFCSENEPNSVSSLCAGNKNCITDRKSRVFNDSLEWMLNPQVFQQILLKMHRLEVDLFASRINHQLTAFVSWRPEPGTMACDALNLNWGLMKGYLFPPFLPDSSLHKKDPARSGRMHLDHTSLEEQAMVPSDSISPGRQTAAVTQGQQTAAIARNRQGASSVQSKEFSLGCMASFRKEVSKQGFSE